LSNTIEGDEANWTLINSGWRSDTPVRAFAASGPYLFAGTGSRGVFRSTDNGQSWTAVNAGLSNRSVWSITVDGPNLFAGTDGGWVFINDSINPIASVSAASFGGMRLAAESIAAAFGSSLATTTEAATAQPLPATPAGASVKVTDSAGSVRQAPLFFVSPTQINYQIPPGTAAGPATVTITSSGGKGSIGTARIDATAAGLFSANANGQGVAAAVALRVKANGARQYEPVARFDAAQNRFVAAPIDPGPESDQVFLILYGTGIRFRGSLSAVSARIGGVDAQALYAGAQGDFAALDQINLRLPRALAGRGEVEVTLIVDGKQANTVEVGVR
jgi:uncharacterized protein (TIGR03437 family)